MKIRTPLIRWLSIVFSFGLIAAACGGSDEVADESADTTEASTDPAEAEPDGGDDDEAIAENEDATAAAGEPIRIGFQNAEGDPAGSFPEYSDGARAAVAYINAELGGLGGRPIELVVCEMAITPDDSQRCANELVAEDVEFVISSINFFGNQYAIFQGAGIPVMVGTPISIPDFVSEGVVGYGSGCFGVHTGLVQFVTQELPDLEGIEVNRVAVPWADTPPGVPCYYDLISKPLDVIKGNISGTAALAGTNPDLEHIGVPMVPASADVTAQATEVLAFDPDVIIYSGQAPDCWLLVDALGRLGWTPEETPLVLSGACIDFAAMAAAGDLALGVYFTGSENTVLLPLEGLTGEHLEMATIYQTKAPEYGLAEEDLFRVFSSQGFNILMSLSEVASQLDGEVTGQSLFDTIAATDGSFPNFGASPLDCQGAPAPYSAVCNSVVTFSQWDGTALAPVLDNAIVSGIDLVSGTELFPGPYETE